MSMIVTIGLWVTRMPNCLVVQRVSHIRVLGVLFHIVPTLLLSSQFFFHRDVFPYFLESISSRLLPLYPPPSCCIWRLVLPFSRLIFKGLTLECPPQFLT